ncbi:MAG: hypothetical protein H6Q29_1010, partial [Bacteroidetes bacterium]|nr:hypothetical protein [Bacteroidota bacterium]
MESILAFLETHKDRYLSELNEFLAIPSVSTHPQNAADV